ncbi:hypothetical protein [Ornithinimicrobium murale]|uniref:hypothetical protein n=1 Tax=Ornithinimicrobium murale TaxID=1050153 RepID=UPI000E0DE2DC|nr:hypothetical protein [Ornithinimicrobium murale]
MSQPFDESQHPRGDQGKFATKSASESSVDLGDQQSGQLADIPDPLDGQTLADGRPAEATFEQSYTEYFRPLSEWEEEHDREFADGDEPQPKEVMETLGFTEADLGRFRGAYLDVDDDLDHGEARLVVHTRNGAGNRECWQDEPYADGCDCTGCTMANRIPKLTGYLYDRDDDGDPTYASIYFELPDDLAQRKRLADIDSTRTLIEDGKAPVWSVLSARADWSPAYVSAPYSLTRELVSVREKVAKLDQVIGDAPRPAKRPEPRTRTVTRGANGRRLRKPREVPVHMAFPDTEYQVASKLHATTKAEMKAAQAELDELDQADVSGQPPAVRALVAGAAADKTAELESLRQSMDDRAWKRDTALWLLHDQREEATARLAQMQADVDRAREENRRAQERDHWTRSWPGDPNEAPDRAAQ